MELEFPESDFPTINASHQVACVFISSIGSILLSHSVVTRRPLVWCFESSPSRRDQTAKVVILAMESGPQNGLTSFRGEGFKIDFPDR